MTTDLLTFAEAQIAEKQYKEIQSVKERLERDKEIIVKAVELVKSHTLYKKISDKYYRSRYKYVLATEEMLKEDYLKEPNGYYEKGIRFLDGDSSRSYNTGILKVNGEVYYDIRFALEQYEEAVRKKTGEVERLNSQIRELQEDIADMKKNFPTLKQAIEEWQKYQKENYQEDYL